MSRLEFTSPLLPFPDACRTHPQIVAECMGDFDDDRSFGRRGSQLLLRWSFISSLIIRDLTLRSATSFGPFHLMRLLCDGQFVQFVPPRAP